MENASSANLDDNRGGLSGAMVVVALAIGGGLALLKRPSTDATDEDREISGAFEQPKKVLVERTEEEAPATTTKPKKRKKKKAKEGDESQEPLVEEPSGDAPEQEDAPEGSNPQETPEQEDAPEGSDPQELDVPANVAFEGEGGWTEVQKRRTGVDACDEHAQRRADRLLDLRRRKVAIAQKLSRVEEGLGGNREDKECKTLEVRARLLEDLNRVNASMKRLSEAAAATMVSEPLHGNDQNPPESTPEPEEVKNDTLPGVGEHEDVGDGSWKTGAWSTWGSSARQWWHDDVEWENTNWRQATGGWSESGGAQAYRPAAARRRRRDLGGGSEATWRWDEDDEQEEVGAGGPATGSAAPRGRWAEEDDEEDEAPGRWKASGNNDQRGRWQAVSEPGSAHTTTGERRGGRRGAGKGARGGRGGSRPMTAVAEDWVDEHATADPSATSQPTKPTRRWQPTAKSMAKLNAQVAVDRDGSAMAETAREEDVVEAAKEPTSSMLGATPGRRPNWGDADSEDEDQLVATAGCVERTRPRWVPTQRSAVPAKGRRAFDPDLVAFMGEDALKDVDKFEEQLKYVPQWVADKARSLRPIMFPPSNEKDCS